MVMQTEEIVDQAKGTEGEEEGGIKLENTGGKRTKQSKSKQSCNY